MGRAQRVQSRVTKIGLRGETGRTDPSLGIKLDRTDTTLDLSHSAKRAEERKGKKFLFTLEEAALK
jgi:hypothetical protein